MTAMSESSSAAFPLRIPLLARLLAGKSASVGAPQPRRTYPLALASRAVGVLTLATWIAAVTVEPVPNGARPVPAAWEVLLAYTSLIAVGAAVWGLAWARSWGSAAGVLNGGLMVSVVAMCPASGHHVIAGWWWAQLGLSALMLAAPAWLLLARRAGRLR
jgi:hypothetical protein